MSKRAGKNRKFTAGILAAGLAVSLIAGCGSGSADYESAATKTAENAAYDAAMDGGIYEYPASEEMAADTAAGAEEGAEQTVVIPGENRKLIRNVDMSVETEEFDVLLQNVRQKVEQLGGYVEQSNVYNGSYTQDFRSRSAHITARIPSAQMDSFVDAVAEQTNVTQKEESVEDVTLRYVDLESHKKALLAEQESLLTMLEKAESIADIITINEQLTSVRYQIESMESQLRTYDNKVDYGTVNLNVEEVAKYEPYKAKSAGEQMSQGFMTNLYRVGNGLKNFGIAFVIALPFLLTAAAFIGIGVGILFLCIRAGEKRAAKKKKAAADKTAPAQKEEERK